MFGKSNDTKEMLEAKYQKLMEEAFVLSRTNRKQGDLKTAEADAVRQQIDAMEES